jgi:site-specific DNA-cytosine methylase
MAEEEEPRSTVNRRVYVKSKRAASSRDDETWRLSPVATTLNGFDIGDGRSTVMIAETGVVTSLTKSLGGAGPDSAHVEAGWIIVGESGSEDPLLPYGLDTNRFRAIGNGVASPVAEWIGRRLSDYLDGRRAGM